MTDDVNKHKKSKNDMATLSAKLCNLSLKSKGELVKNVFNSKKDDLNIEFEKSDCDLFGEYQNQKFEPKLELLITEGVDYETKSTNFLGMSKKMDEGV